MGIREEELEGIVGSKSSYVASFGFVLKQIKWNPDNQKSFPALELPSLSQFSSSRFLEPICV